MMDGSTARTTTPRTTSLVVGQALAGFVVVLVAMLLALVFVAAWRPDLIDRALAAWGR